MTATVAVDKETHRKEPDHGTEGDTCGKCFVRVFADGIAAVAGTIDDALAQDFSRMLSAVEYGFEFVPRLDYRFRGDVRSGGQQRAGVLGELTDIVANFFDFLIHKRMALLVSGDCHPLHFTA
jgi:hypothetical protein